MSKHDAQEQLEALRDVSHIGDITSPVAVEWEVDKENRSSLTKMVMRLFDHWQIPVLDQAILLNRSPSSIRRYRAGGCFAADNETLDRVGALLGIHKSLRIIFPHNRDLVYELVSAKNQAFGGKAPIEIMLQGLDGILEIRRYLEAMCEK